MLELEEPIYDERLKTTVERTNPEAVVKWDTARIKDLVTKQAEVDATAEKRFTEEVAKQEAAFRAGSAAK
jgi:hypothetical protein